MDTLVNGYLGSLGRKTDFKMCLISIASTPHPVTVANKGLLDSLQNPVGDWHHGRVNRSKILHVCEGPFWGHSMFRFEP